MPFRRPASRTRAPNFSGRLERLLRLAVGHELDAGHQAGDPDVADERVLAQPVERRGERALERGGPLGQPLALPDPEHGEPGGRGHRVAAEREDVLERGAACLERLADVLPRRDRAERRIPAAHALAHHEQVGHDAPVVGRERPARPPEARHDLVEDQQHAVAVADLADARPVVVLGRDRAADRRDDRLPDDRGDAARPGGQDRRLDLGRGGLAAVGMGVRPRAAVAVGRPDVRRLRAAAARRPCAGASSRRRSGRPASPRGSSSSARRTRTGPARRAARGSGAPSSARPPRPPSRPR